MCALQDTQAACKPLPQVTDVVNDGEVADAHKNLPCQLLVLWPHLDRHVEGNLVEDVEHHTWDVCQPACQCAHRLGQVFKINDERLLVVWAGVSMVSA